MYPTSGDQQSARTVLICHNMEPLNRRALARWLASFTNLVGIIEIHEPKSRLRKRIRRELERVGWWRFFDVLAMRLYGRLFLRADDERWIKETLQVIESQYADVPSSVSVLKTGTPNSKDAEDLLKRLQPDLIIARCKHLLNERVFGLARIGTFVMHPGICPEYRNAHGCFWALANRDLGNVGMTLLKIDKGVDTGPVYGYFRCDVDEIRESHNIIQNRVVFDNLDTISDTFKQIIGGSASTISTEGRKSQAWGQPWLTAYLRWKRAARKARTS